MKITRNTPQHLIIEDQPISLMVWTVGFLVIALFVSYLGIMQGKVLHGLFWGVLAVAPIAALLYFVLRVQVVLDRPKIRFWITRGWMFKTILVKHQLSELSHAIVADMPRNPVLSYGVCLVIKRGQSAGNHPIAASMISKSEAQKVADQINRWLRVA